MILVTLGTQDKSFERLLKAVQKAIDEGYIKEKVVVQAGYTEFTSKDMEIFDFIPRDRFDELIEKCDILITHAGVGSILTGLNNGKKVIAAARLSEYKEHINDHQIQIVEKFDRLGYILPLKDFDKLGELIKEAKKFQPKKYVSNTENIIKHLEEYIDSI